MGFVKTMDEIASRHRETAEFYDAEVLTVYFETTPETIQRLLPPPLSPPPFPIGAAFVAHYPKTNFGKRHRRKPAGSVRGMTRRMHSPPYPPLRGRP